MPIGRKKSPNLGSQSLTAGTTRPTTGAVQSAAQRAGPRGAAKNGYVWAFVSHVLCIVGGWDCACVLLSPPSRHGCVSCVRSLVW